MALAKVLFLQSTLAFLYGCTALASPSLVASLLFGARTLGTWLSYQIELTGVAALFVSGLCCAAGLGDRDTQTRAAKVLLITHVLALLYVDRRLFNTFTAKGRDLTPIYALVSYRVFLCFLSLIFLAQTPSKYPFLPPDFDVEEYKRQMREKYEKEEAHLKARMKDLGKDFNAEAYKEEMRKKYYEQNPQGSQEDKKEE